MRACHYPRECSNGRTPVSEHTPPVISVNFNPRTVGLIAAIVTAGLLVAVFWGTSYYTVGAESEAVVLRFGKFLKTVEPGLHFKLPFGVDEVFVLPTQRQLKLEFGFTTPGYLTNPIQASQDELAEKSMVTGDLNAALWSGSSSTASKIHANISSMCATRDKLFAICRRPRCAR